MKKLVLLFLLLVALVLFSHGQPAASSAGFKTGQNYYQPSGNRSVPPGTVVWSQLPDCEANIWACQLDANTPFDARMADDFIFYNDPGQIGAVRWWIGWWNPPNYAAPASFNIYIYDEVSCFPGNVVAQWNIPLADAHEDNGCLISWPSREYWAVLNPPFQPAVNQHYWIVCQPVMNYPPQTGAMMSNTQNLCNAKLYFPLLNFYWATLEEYDMAFELYANVVIPVSGWALLLGGVLIVLAVFFRYRKSW